MQASDFAAFRAMMTGLGKVYERELDQPLLDAYWLALEDWTLVDFSAAAKHLMRCGRFFPRPSDFEDLRRSASQRDAVEAWETARSTARNAISLGRVRTDVTSGDPRIDRTVAAIGGYGAIALCDSAWLHALERRFFEAYREARDVAEARAALPHLAPSAQLAKGAQARGTGPAAGTGIERRHAQGPTSVEELLRRRPSVAEGPVPANRTATPATGLRPARGRVGGQAESGAAPCRGATPVRSAGPVPAAGPESGNA